MSKLDVDVWVGSGYVRDLEVDSRRTEEGYAGGLEVDMKVNCCNDGFGSFYADESEVDMWVCGYVGSDVA